MPPVHNPRIAPALLVVTSLAALAAYLVPRGLEAHALLAIEDDPVCIAEYALYGRFDAGVAEREIKSDSIRRWPIGSTPR